MSTIRAIHTAALLLMVDEIHENPQSPYTLS